VYSEMAKQQAPTPQLDNILTRIEENAGDMIQSMSDIVWMINPKYDNFTYVIQRMENFASGFLSLKDIQYTLTKESGIEELKLDMEKRKNIFLIFKEALHNAAKHAGCRKVDIHLNVSGRMLDMIIADDGTGFEPAHQQNGNGLDNMAKRAEEVGGQFKLDSRAGEGTTIQVIIPV
ncbi:MAG TPA: ATP-binding protein, partial [Saprospiraceae bacterium]|nr:ATP-binding protein [Saprospiraceae bacterium]